MIYEIVSFFHKYGWKGLYALFFPVHWKQDKKFTNNGYDIITIKDSPGGYFRGTLKERDSWRYYYGNTKQKRS